MQVRHGPCSYKLASMEEQPGPPWSQTKIGKSDWNFAIHKMGRKWHNQTWNSLRYYLEGRACLGVGSSGGGLWLCGVEGVEEDSDGDEFKGMVLEMSCLSSLRHISTCVPLLRNNLLIFRFLQWFVSLTMDCNKKCINFIITFANSRRKKILQIVWKWHCNQEKKQDVGHYNAYASQIINAFFVVYK